MVVPMPLSLLRLLKLALAFLTADKVPHCRLYGADLIWNHRVGVFFFPKFFWLSLGVLSPPEMLTMRLTMREFNIIYGVHQGQIANRIYVPSRL